jgi:hypothetical protein
MADKHESGEADMELVYHLTERQAALVAACINYTITFGFVSPAKCNAVIVDLADLHKMFMHFVTPKAQAALTVECMAADVDALLEKLFLKPKADNDRPL